LATAKGVSLYIIEQMNKLNNKKIKKILKLSVFYQNLAKKKKM